MYDYFVTINTTDWQNSPYVPKSNAKMATEKNVYGNDTACWYIDSKAGKWSTILYSTEQAFKGETAIIFFWAKICYRRKGTFMVEIFQKNWEERTTYPLQKKCQYIAGCRGDYYLFSIPYTAQEDHMLHFTLSVNDIEVIIFPATESDLNNADFTLVNSEEILEDTEDCRIVSCYRQNFPRTRFVGISYADSDNAENGYSQYWGQWFETGKFDILEKGISEDFNWEYPDTNAYIGLSRYKEGRVTEYWIGMFLPEKAEVPAGFSYIDFNFNYAGICWVKGKEEFVHGNETECYKKVVKNGMKVWEDKDGSYWQFERCGCPRYTTPDENDEVILDIGFFLEG